MNAKALTIGGAAGAAFTLQDPARETVTLTHEEYQVTIRAGAPLVTIQFIAADETSDPTTIRDRAWKTLQEALDLNAVMCKEPLACRDSDFTYLTWLLGADGYHLTFVETCSFPWNMQMGHSVAGETKSMGSTMHHPAFRFYRLSQVSNDLFDAYRNAYLALECLVSEVEPKQSSASEPAWLKRVLSGPLAGGLPPKVDVDKAVDELYKQGRLPLFHAKIGQLFFEPSGCERERIRQLFYDVTQLLASLFHFKFGPAIPLRGGAWLSQETRDAMIESSLVFDHAVLRGDHGEEQNLVITAKVKANPRRFDSLWGSLRFDGPFELGEVRNMDLCKSGERLFLITLPEAISLDKIAVLTVELQFLLYHIREPKLKHTT